MARLLVVTPAAEHLSPSILDRLTQEYGLADELGGARRCGLLQLRRDGDRAILVLEDDSGEPRGRMVGAPVEVGRFGRLALN
jgi:hypothetical protein